VARDQREYATARAHLGESLALARQVNHQSWDHAVAHYSLGRLALADGMPVAACASFRESLKLMRATGFQLHLARCLEGIAATWASTDTAEPEAPTGPPPSGAARAACLLGAASAVREAIGALISPEDRPHCERAVTLARAALGEEAFAAAWAEGRAMTLETAMAYALEPV
jgi:hypothetical protein